MSNTEPEQPRALDAEVWLLGGVFQDQRIMSIIYGLLSPSDFYLEKHQNIWQAMQELQKSETPIDIVTVSAILKQNGQVQSLFDNISNKNEYLFSLLESVPSAANCEFYIGLIKEASLKRQLIAAGRKIIANGYDVSKTSGECFSSAQEIITRIASGTNNTQIEHIGDLAEKMLESIAQRKKEGKKGGIASDFFQMDNLTGGFRKGELTIVGARPGVGKTSFALGLAIKAAKEAGPVLMFSLEMNGEQQAARAMSYYSQVSVKKTMDATLDMVEMQNQREAARVLKNAPLYIDLIKDHNVAQITSIAHSYAAKMPLSMIIVDYLQIIETNPDRKNYENRNVAIGAITRALKVLSGKLNCPVIALSQLNRDTDKTSTASARKPRLSDLRESGNIEQDADVVMLLHRIPVPGPNVDITKTDLIIAKNRSGPTGEVKIHFNPQNIMFSEYEQYNY
ncbi:MAG: replicative DNA helicase [Fibromonadaceae bacterium]|jgi:replicative DNA helicase|nr:replicative DNA helicase [Fibromonadaceae bacterium]